MVSFHPWFPQWKPRFSLFIYLPSYYWVSTPAFGNAEALRLWTEFCPEELLRGWELFHIPNFVEDGANAVIVLYVLLTLWNLEKLGSSEILKLIDSDRSFSEILRKVTSQFLGHIWNIGSESITLARERDVVFILSQWGFTSREIHRLYGEGQNSNKNRVILLSGKKGNVYWLTNGKCTRHLCCPSLPFHQSSPCH